MITNTRHNYTVPLSGEHVCIRDVDSFSRLIITKIHYHVRLHQNVTGSYQAVAFSYPKNSGIALKVKRKGQMSRQFTHL